MLSPVFTPKEKIFIQDKIDDLITYNISDYLEKPVESEIIEHHYDLLVEDLFKKKILDDVDIKFVYKFYIPFKENDFDLFITVKKGNMSTLVLNKFFFIFDIGYLDISKKYLPIEGLVDEKGIFISSSKTKYNDQINTKSFQNYFSKYINRKSTSAIIKIEHSNFLTINENTLCFSFPLEVDNDELLVIDLFGKITIINKILKEIVSNINGNN